MPYLHKLDTVLKMVDHRLVAFEAPGLGCEVRLVTGVYEPERPVVASNLLDGAYPGP